VAEISGVEWVDTVLVVKVVDRVAQTSDGVVRLASALV